MWSFLPEKLRGIAALAAAASRRAHCRRGDPTDYLPFSGSWELSAGLVLLVRTMPLTEARHLVLVLWSEIVRLEYARREVEQARVRERDELLARIDGLNHHIDSLGGP